MNLMTRALMIMQRLSVAAFMACLCLAGSSVFAGDADETKPKTSALGRLARPKQNSVTAAPSAPSTSLSATDSTPTPTATQPSSIPKKGLSGLSGLKMPRSPSTAGSTAPSSTPTSGASSTLGHSLSSGATPAHKPLGSGLKSPLKLPGLKKPEPTAAPATATEEFSALLGDDKPKNPPAATTDLAEHSGLLGDVTAPSPATTTTPAATSESPLGGERPVTAPSTAAPEATAASSEPAKSSVFGDVGLPTTPAAPVAEEKPPANTDVALKFDANFAKIAIYGAANGTENRLEMTLVAANRWEADPEFAMLDSGDLGGFLFEATQRDKAQVDFGLLKLLSHDIYANGIGYRDGQAFERPDQENGGVIFGIPKPGTGKYHVVFDDVRRIYTCTKL